MRTGLKTFYRRFLNYNLFRDYRNQRPLSKFKGMNCLKNDKFVMQHSANLDYREAILKWLIRNNMHPSKHYYELSYYKDMGDFRLDDKANKYNDRLMFDFDLDNEHLDLLKKKIKEINYDDNLKWKQKEREIKKVQKQYQDIILNTNTIIPAYEEAKELAEYFSKCNIPFYSEFSGGKGFHHYIFFDEIRSRQINNKFVLEEAVKVLGQDFQNKFNFKTLDQAPFGDILSRLGRLPYSTHESSLLKVVPCDLLNEPLTDILSRAKKKKNNYIDFKVEPSKDFRILLNRYMNFTTDKLQQQEKISKLKTINTGAIHGTISDKYKDSIFQDMRVLCRFIIGDYFVSSHDKYDLYKCCFHDYDHASVIVSEKAYNCKSNTCTAEVQKQFGTDKLNYWNFLKKYFNLKHDSEVRGKMKELNSQYETATK